MGGQPMRTSGRIAIPALFILATMPKAITKINRMRTSLTFQSLACFVAALCAGCTAVNPLKTAPASADKPWQSSQIPALATKLAPLTADAGAPRVDPSHTYTLVELVDLAQRSNRSTRAAWE